MFKDNCSILFSALPSPLLSLLPDADFTIAAVNTAFTETAGIAESMLIGKPFDAAFIGKDELAQRISKQHMHGVLQDVLHTGRLVTVCVQLRNAASATAVIFECKMIPVAEGSGNSKRIICALTLIAGGSTPSPAHPLPGTVNTLLTARPEAASLDPFRQAVETAQEGIWLMDEHYQTTYVNKRLCEILGYSYAEMIDHGGPAFKQEKAQINALSQNGKEKGTGELVFITKQGAKVWIQLSVSPLCTEQGQNSGLMVVLIDITKGELTRQQMASLINNTEEAFILLNTNLEIVLFNNQFQELYEKLLGRTVSNGDAILDFSLPGRRGALKETYERVLQGAHEEYEITIPVEGSPEKTFVLKYKPAKDGSGTIIGAFVSAIDVTEKKKSAQQLALNEMRYRALVENSTDAVVILTAAGKPLYISPSVENILGYTEAESMQMNLFSLIHPDDADEIAGHWQAVMQTHGIPVSGLISRMRHKDGSWRWFAGTLTNLLNNPAVCGIVDNFRDITDTINNLQALETEKTRFDKIMESSLDVICAVDVNGVFLQVSHAARKIWGYAPHELIGKPMINLVHPDDRERTLATAASIMDGRNMIDFENRYVHKDGSVVPVSWSASWDPKTQTRYAVARDATQKKKTELALVESERKYKLLFEQSPLPKWIYDVDTMHIQEVNQAAIDHYGFSREEFLHMSLIDLRPSSEVHRLLETQTENKHRKGAVRFGLYTHQKKDKTQIRVEISSSGFHYQGLDCMMVVCNDVTEREHAFEQLKESNLRYDYVNKATSDAIWDWNLVSNAIYWGEGFQTIFGYSLRDLKLDISSWTDHIHPDDHDRIVRGIYEFIEGTEINWSSEYRYLKQDLTYADVFDRGFVIRNEQGKAIRMIGAMQDITQRKKADEEIKKSNERFELIGRAANDAVWELDLETNIVWGNATHQELYGLSLADPVPDDNEWQSRLLPEERDHVHKSLQDALASDANIWYGEYHLKTNNKGWINVYARTYIERNSHGKAVRMIGSMVNITKRKQEEQQQALLADIGLLFNDTVALNEILKKLAVLLVKSGQFRLSEIWLVSTDKKRMSRIAAHSATGNAMVYDEGSIAQSCEQGEGLAGLTWQTGETQLWPNYLPGKGPVQQLPAETAVGQVVYGLPITYKTEVIGAFVLSLSRPEQTTGVLPFLFEELGKYAGAEIKRKQLEQELNQLFNTVPDIICIMGADGYFKKINAAVCLILEYTEAELLAVPLTNFVHPDDRELTDHNMAKLANGDSSLYFENRYISKSGKLKWLGWSTTHSVEEGVLFSVAKDITDKKELEDLLNRANALARMGSWEVDMLKGTVYWSAITREIHEADSSFEPTMEMAVNVYKDGEHRNQIIQCVQDAIDNGTPWDVELQIITKKGNEKWVRSIGQREFVNGKCLRLYGSFQDIHANKMAELAAVEVLREKNIILESIGDAFFAVDKQWVVTYWNKQAEKMLQVSKDKVIGHHLWEVFASSTGSNSYQKYHQALENNEIIHFEDYYEVMHKWYEISAYPSGSGLSVYFKDITERKTAEAAIKNSEEKRRLIMNAALDAIICIDTSGNITFWNPQAAYIFGWEEQEVLGKRLSDLIIPQQFRQRHDDGLLQYLHTGTGPALNVLLQLSAVKRSGEEFPVELTVLPIRQGKEEFFCAFIRDITQRKKAEDDIRTSNEQYNMVAKATNDSLWDWNLVTGELSRLGDGFRTLFGYAANNADNLYWTKLIHPDDLPRVRELQNNLFNKADEYYWEDEYRFLKADNTYAHVYDKGYIVRNHNGKAVRMIGSTQDVTKLKENEILLRSLNHNLQKQAKALAVSNAELEQFAYVASHDLQEPLRMITSFVTQLDKRYSAVLDDKGKRYIDFAVDGARRMRQIILDLLEFSRVGRIAYSTERINLNELLDEICILTSKQIEEKNAVITVEQLPQIDAHQTPMRQVFQNLIGNALKYTRNNVPARIHISGTELETHWQFSVADNGIGIDKEYFDRIFILFQRLHNKDEFSGTGMGLAITKKIVDSMGGKIWVSSEEEQGSTFYFTILKAITNEEARFAN